MRIAVIAPTPYFSDRGCHIRIANEVAILTAAGHSVTLFTYHNGRTPDQDINNPNLTIKRIAQVRWYTKTSAGAAWGKLWLDWKLYRLTRKTFSNASFDVIHAHLHEGGLIAWLLKRRFNTPVLLDLQDNLVETLHTQRFATIWPLPWLAAHFERWLMRQADAIVGSSTALTDHISTLLPAGSDTPVEALPDQPHSLPTASTTITRHNLEIEADEPIIIYTGGISKAKGVHTLVEAFAQVLASYPAAQLLIAGSGNAQVVHELVATKGIAGSVQIITPLEFQHLPAYLALADIAVEPKPATSSEGSGKLVYYQMAGLPTIAFRRGSVSDDTGVLWVSNDTAGDLAQALLRLLDNPAERLALADAAKLWSAAQPTWHDQLPIIEHLYERITR